ncbi:response regulator [Candidatus Nitrospira bockiana]
MSGHAVLLIDDDEALLQALPGLLEFHLPAVQIDIASSVDSALNQAARKNYDVILTDLRMPRVVGLSLLRQLRDLRPNTPIVVISGHADEETARSALLAGADSVLHKPLDRDCLIAKLKRFLAPA